MQISFLSNCYLILVVSIQSGCPYSVFSFLSHRRTDSCKEKRKKQCEWSSGKSDPELSGTKNSKYYL